MRRNYLWILLAVSLVANVFFAGGALYAYYAHSDRSVQEISRQLDLTPAQRQGLEDLREAVAARRSAMSDSRGGLRDAMVAALAEPAFDRERVAALVEEWSESRRGYFVDVAQDVHAYVATLTPEQRAKFLELARDRTFMRRLLRSRR